VCDGFRIDSRTVKRGTVMQNDYLVPLDRF
jgi:hypothetical protein